MRGHAYMIEISQEDFDEFTDAVGAPAEGIPALQKLLEWQTKNDPVAVAAFNRTEGFVPAEEYAKRLQQQGHAV